MRTQAEITCGLFFRKVPQLPSGVFLVAPATLLHFLADAI
jgi:hypothetical protein